MEERKELWEDLRHHQDSAMFNSKAWMIVGDFNEILEGNESSVFMEQGRVPSGMRDFQQMALDICFFYSKKHLLFSEFNFGRCAYSKLTKNSNSYGFVWCEQKSTGNSNFHFSLIRLSL